MKKYRASKLDLREVSKALEKDFLNKYHYQGFVGSNWCKGLFDKDELITLMSFGKPRYNKNYDWELIRLCTKEDCQVYGGASRLLKNFKEENPGSIVSYCNLSHFSGKVYDALGFEHLYNTNSYHYEKNGKCYNRGTFQRWKLEKLYPQYPREKYTEKQVMELLGYTRVEEIQGTYVIDSDRKWYIYEIICDDYHYIGQHRYFHNNLDDNYRGSGAFITRLTKNHPYEKYILCYGLTSQEAANEAEKAYIRASRDKYGIFEQGGKNCNFQDGGTRDYVKRDKGTKSTGRKHTLEEIEKIRNANLGKIVSEYTRNLISESRKEYYKTHDGVWKGKTPTGVSKMSQTKKARFSKMSKEEKSRFFTRHTAGGNAKISATLKARNANLTPEELEAKKQRVRDGVKRARLAAELKIHEAGLLISSERDSHKQYEVVMCIGHTRGYREI